MENYTTEGMFTEYFGANEPVPIPYGRVEDVSVLLLEEYSYAFPSVEEYKEMKTSDVFVYDCITKAILEQMKYYYENQEEIDNPGGTQAYSVGRVSVSASNKTAEQQSADKFSPIAVQWLERSGIVVKQLCDGDYSPCFDCGCDLL